MLGELYLAPIVNGRVHRVLDVGTGTGIWAIEFCIDYFPITSTILMYY
jgi:ubiquinone/menaquinone biosynthesis C-methylase UbiE